MLEDKQNYEEEEVAIVAEEPKEEEVEVSPAEAPVVEDDPNKANLITFILALIGLTLCAAWQIGGGIACLVLGIISFKRSNTVPEATKQPFIVFRKIARIVGIVDIPLGAVATVGMIIYYIVQAVNAAAAAAA